MLRNEPGTDANQMLTHLVRPDDLEILALGNTPWGDRAGRVRDPLGNLWWIMTRMEDLSEDEIAERWGQPEYVEAMLAPKTPSSSRCAGNRAAPASALSV